MADMNHDVIVGAPEWCGEQWVNRQRRPGDTKDWGVVSLYHTRWSGGGEGTVAVVDIGGPVEFRAICTDSMRLAEWAMKMIRDHGNNYDPPLPVVLAQFSSGGDTTVEPTWTIRAEGHAVIARWKVTEPPIALVGDWAGDRKYGFSLLAFTYDADIRIDGRLIEGKPYERDIWKALLKTDKMMSSCCFGLAETFGKKEGNVR